MGYGRPDALAMLAIVRAAKACAQARKWWRLDVETLAAANLQVLQESVRKIAARYSLAFLLKGLPLTPELAAIERKLLEDKVMALCGFSSSNQ